MFKLLVLFILIGCKDNIVETKGKDTERTIEVLSSEDFEGRYYMPNGGIVELYNDYNNQIATISNSLVYPNSNNSLATITIGALVDLDILDNVVITPLAVLTGSNASVFVGNISGQASNGVQLVNTGTYRHKFKFSFNSSNKLVVELEIQQLISGSYVTVYLNSVTEL